MFNIYLYHFTKKVNSTKEPDVSPDTFQCLMRSGSSIVNPIIEIRMPQKTDMLTYNYAYIPSFGSRYYFIDDIEYDAGVFVLRMSVDVLATYKSDIRASTQFILRAANLNNYNIIDTAYLTKKLGNANEWGFEYLDNLKFRINLENNYTSLQIGDYFGIPLSDGTFILGIVGHNATGMQYYAFSYNAFRELINNIFTIQPSDMTDVSSGVANALFKPIEYIVSCKWYPYVPAACKDTGTTVINIGNQPVTLTNTVYPLLTNQIPEFIMSTPVPDNPQASTYAYMDYEPFREVNLYFQPFGNIALDTTKIGYRGGISACWQIDYCTGVAHLKVNCQEGTSNGQILAEISGDYGVAIPISSLVTDWKTAAWSTGLTYLNNSPIGDIVETGHQ